MPLKTIIKKLRHKSAAEIAFRIAETLRRRMESIRYEDELKKVTDERFNFFKDASQIKTAYFNDDLQGLLDSLSESPPVCETLDESKKRIFIEQYAKEYEQSRARVEQLLQHQFDFLGFSFELPDPIPWQCDPVSLRPYPTGFYNEIDIFTNENAGDVKHVWEINRLQFIIETAKIYFVSGEQRYGDKIEAWIDDWVRSNPYKTGIAWTSALEVGVRVIALVWILKFYLASERQQVKTIKQILKLLYLSGQYLEDNLSIYFSPYNHLIGETAGLFAVGYLFPFFKKAKQWQKKAWTILQKQLGRQFHEDGGSVEQATFYHHFTLGFYIQVIQWRRLNNDVIPSSMLERIQKALEFAMYLTRPDGSLPHIGDIDDARSILFGHPTHWDFRAFQAIGAVWFERSDMKYMARRLPEDAFWLLSKEEREQFKVLQSQTPELNTIRFASSGYTVMRSGYKPDSHFAIMDHGPLADGVFHDETPSAAHGHADLLSFELAPFGRSMLIDPGFSNYRGDFNWHAYFRSTAAHNTLEVDGYSQAEQGKILQWRYAPRYRLLQVHKGHRIQGVCAEHYGYIRLPGEIVHRRLFVYVDQRFWLSLDWLFANEADHQNKHKVAAYLHFDEDVNAKNGNRNGYLTAEKEDVQLNILALDDQNKPLTFSIKKGGANPEDGWISPTYLARKAAPLALTVKDTLLPVRWSMIFLPQKAADQEASDMETAMKQITIRSGSQRYRITYDADENDYTASGLHEYRKELIIEDMNTNQVIASFKRLRSNEDNGNGNPILEEHGTGGSIA